MSWELRGGRVVFLRILLIHVLFLVRDTHFFRQASASNVSYNFAEFKTKNCLKCHKSAKETKEKSKNNVILKRLVIVDFFWGLSICCL